MMWIMVYIIISASLLATMLPLRMKHLRSKHLLLIPTLPVLLFAVMVILTDGAITSLWYKVRGEVQS